MRLAQWRQGGRVRLASLIVGGLRSRGEEGLSRWLAAFLAGVLKFHHDRRGRRRNLGAHLFARKRNG